MKQERRQQDKDYFHVGDEVYFKGIPEHEQPILKVLVPVVWKTNDDGSLVTKEREENGEVKKSHVPDGMVVGWFQTHRMEDGTLLENCFIEKKIDTRSVYLKRRTVGYFLNEAKKHAINQNNNELVKLINEALNLT
jgi:hypothetical protein